MSRSARARETTVGSRIRRYREKQDKSLSQLARDSGVSKSYLWRLENPPPAGHPQRPSARTLFAVAKALGVAISDLLGEQLVLEHETTIDPILQAFADQEDLSQADLDMLASIQWRGERPKTLERWRYVYNALATSRMLDE